MILSQPTYWSMLTVKLKYVTSVWQDQILILNSIILQDYQDNNKLSSLILKGSKEKPSLENFQIMLYRDGIDLLKSYWLKKTTLSP